MPAPTAPAGDPPAGKTRSKLTNAAIAKALPAAKPYKIVDDAGLYLDVRPSGRKVWRYRFRLAEKESIYTLGDFDPERLDRDKARTARDRARDLVRQGKNPTTEERVQALRDRYAFATTFGAVLDEWLATCAWGAATRRNREAQINLHVRPHLSPLPVREITPMMVLDVLRRAEKPGTVTKKTGRGARTRRTGSPAVARRLRQVIASVMDLAVQTERADRNPAGGLRGALTKAKRVVHKTPLTVLQIGTVLRAIDGYQGHLQTPIAFRLLWWTAVRPVEACGAQWSEFDLEAGTWTIPPERMKTHVAHQVPLPRQAVETLSGLKATTGALSPNLFPHRDERDRPMTTDALAKAVKRMALGFEYSPHATRTTASTMLNEKGYRFDVIEAQLAHQDKDAVRRAYNRARYLDERREMMQTWANWLDEWKAGAKVLPLKAA